MTDDQIIECATGFRRGMLGRKSSAGHCAMVCWPLTTLLPMQGLKCESKTVQIGIEDIAWSNHVFIQLEDGRVLDPTLDQFGDHPPVYLGEPIAEFHKGI